MWDFEGIPAVGDALADQCQEEEEEENDAGNLELGDHAEDASADEKYRFNGKHFVCYMANRERQRHTKYCWRL